MRDTMTPIKFNDHLTSIAEMNYCRRGAHGVAHDVTVVTFAIAFHSAVLKLYNNTLRAVGIEVGDADSESNAAMLQPLADTILARANEARRQERDRAEEEIRRRAAAPPPCPVAEAESLRAEVDRLVSRLDAIEAKLDGLAAAMAKTGLVVFPTSNVAETRDAP